MSEYNFLPTNIPGGSDPNSTYTYRMNQLDLSDFEISDFLIQEAGSEEDSTSTQVEDGSSNTLFANQFEETQEKDRFDNKRAPYNAERKLKTGGKKTKTDVGFRVAFRTKSEQEIMDDGYKWRKYGKKSVKNSPNPRNYYRCSHGGCHVKKRVERDREDSSYVLTTYDAMHNHESPSVVYYNEIPLMVPNGWPVQASS